MKPINVKKLYRAVQSKIYRWPRTGDELYEKAEKKAEPIKACLQMLLGIVIVIVLIYQWIDHWHALPLDVLADRALTLVGGGLAISAVVELAYTFFTPGPDEALDPLILGISSFALINISRGNAKLDNSHIIPLFLLALALFLLFLARRYLLPGLMSRTNLSPATKRGLPVRADQGGQSPPNSAVAKDEAANRAP